MNIILPELGEGITKATLVCWHFKEGDVVKLGDEVCEVTTDKATFNVEAPSNGRLKSIFVKEGQEGTVGGQLGSIE